MRTEHFTAIAVLLRPAAERGANWQRCWVHILCGIRVNVCVAAIRMVCVCVCTCFSVVREKAEWTCIFVGVCVCVCSIWRDWHAPGQSGCISDLTLSNSKSALCCHIVFCCAHSISKLCVGVCVLKASGSQIRNILEIGSFRVSRSNNCCFNSTISYATYVGHGQTQVCKIRVRTWARMWNLFSTSMTTNKVNKWWP